MGHTAWRLVGGGLLLEIYRIDPETRKATLILPLKLKKPMTEEDALKYVNSNYPKDGSPVKLAAERLGLPTRKQ